MRWSSGAGGERGGVPGIDLLLGVIGYPVSPWSNKDAGRLSPGDRSSYEMKTSLLLNNTKPTGVTTKNSPTDTFYGRRKN